MLFFRVFSFCAYLALISGSVLHPAYAQPIDEVPAPTAEAPVPEESTDGEGRRRLSPSEQANRLVDTFGDAPPIDVVDMKTMKDDYIDPNFRNLSKLMWALGVLDLSDNLSIDNFLMINECDLFLRFFNNDLEWEKIREATREHIRSNVSKFPTKFEVLVPLYLGRYNSSKQYFELEEDSRMNNLRRLDINMNAHVDVCGEKGRQLRGYSRNLILTFNRPFSLTRIPVSRPLAELYIEEARANFENLPPKLQIALYERMAYLRAKVTVTSFKETVDGRHGELTAVVFAQLDGIEIYADLDRQKLLYKEDKKPKTIRQRRREERDGGIRPDAFGVEDSSPQAEPLKKKEEPVPVEKLRGLTPYSEKALDLNALKEEAE